MTLFLLIYLSIYGGIHLYAFIKLKRGFALGLPAYLILAIFMILMVVAPIVVRISERYGYEALARGWCACAKRSKPNLLCAQGKRNKLRMDQRERWTDHVRRCFREKLEERKQNLLNALNDLAETEE